MPRANRYRIPGFVWHLTHRCHRRQFLLGFRRDQRNWQHWLYQARKRFDLCVLDYTVTCNHIHLLVRDQGRGEVSASMQLLEGRTGQDYNQRKSRQGAFWRDCYHATAVETGEHLARCVTYIDLNMVRAGVVSHPREWEAGGYHEIQRQRERYRIIDRAALAEALEIDLPNLAAVHEERIAAALRQRGLRRQACWTASVAVGSRGFAEQMVAELGGRARHRHIESCDDAFVVREAEAPYLPGLRPRNGQIDLSEGSPQG